jgi:hypothetical protein
MLSSDNLLFREMISSARGDLFRKKNKKKGKKVRKKGKLLRKRCNIIS